MTGRVDISLDQVRDLVSSLGEVVVAEPIDGGFFATALRLTFADGTRSVMKAVSADTSRLSRYEHGILGTEARVFEMLADTEVPVPTVQLADFTRTLVPADVLVTSHLPGVVWNGLDIADADAAALRRGLGAAMAAAHRVEGPHFGYPAAASALAAPTWPAAFGLMVEAALTDAETWGVALPVDRVRRALHDHQIALTTVKRASVVHTDLWPGNVFVDADEMRIVGIIDTERTVWGDPLIDLVGAEPLSTEPPDADLLAGDGAAGGELAAILGSPAGEARLNLCRMYMALLYVTEVTIRGYDGEFALSYESAGRANLEIALARLEELAPGNGSRCTA
ncbi:aminoglycoside phosphotransferase (APT) family kinase protein [Microbacterium terrae]|uniref:Phosphotransferase enzyme family protein n=1 Tax=Microbacterium terrae TaxID=69369 RepID=A0A0M2H5L0_9MICO|nr:phosphotransferase [Microbacterium terrae]KJL39115.1 Phosphotransferase enzyme family protein [Microbacterium terrae]MBP1077730.1 aminoglycoside phosphotransferase (APT) family kinase protein [Microbacterium terrae]GLJ99898.1 phosphotransferase [Microbacterium terrae]